MRARNHVPLVFDNPEKFTRGRLFEEQSALAKLAGARSARNPSEGFLFDVAASAQNAEVHVREACAAYRTPMDLPIAEKVIAAVESARGKVVKWPTMGGSVPLGAMERAANTHTITVPIANHDNNQHSANENIRLQNLWDGIEVFAGILTEAEINWPAAATK